MNIRFRGHVLVIASFTRLPSHFRLHFNLTFSSSLVVKSVRPGIYKNSFAAKAHIKSHQAMVDIIYCYYQQVILQEFISTIRQFVHSLRLTTAAECQLRPLLLVIVCHSRLHQHQCLSCGLDLLIVFPS